MVDRQDVRRAAGAAKDAAGDAERHASRLERSRGMRIGMRVGHVANGIVHLALAGIVVAVAVGAGGGSADQGGAMAAIAATPLGVGALWAVSIALVALAVFALLEGVAQRASGGGKALAKGIGKAIAYAAVAATGIRTALGSGGGGDAQAESLSGALMAQPFGQVLVGVVGVGVLAIGVAFVVQGARRSFEKHVSPPASARRAVTALGVAGYVAKGVAIALVGVLFVAAAIAHDPQEAGGLDGGLRSLQQLPFGVAALLVVGLGLGAYGVFSIVRGIWASKR
ncbi:DUF1206 domain-containing protein [Agrococcus sp. SGAir0287]|uniref:DUF1206 domain-containing protein n=1 Tax=Agrococcus sp. SGAir0287 TaxID=2070347 RepID=UPI0010CD2E7C|nr:DUF1206 domain-containing protein [Agrococcus sp. SGAir0287]QCR20381.1 hypothetical protein C1N71_13790 [Agrococcus sp. SGAir0287]